MCGIVGIFSAGDRARLWPDAAINTMLARVRHRGPDGMRVHSEPGLALGHARLAVLDLSAAGQQPMFSDGGRYVASYNGEIYNFRGVRSELQALGHSFVSNSDTEVLLAAWKEWGERCLEKFDGIFAFALVDRQERVLFLVRDHVGVKPLFYRFHAGAVFFASELPALFSDYNPVPAENREDLDAYFTFNYLAAPRSGLDGVKQLEAGSLLRIDADGERLSRYWCVPYREELLPWSPAAVEQFRDILFRSVKSQLVADVPLGVFLSGGLDSYAVALAAVSTGEQPQAFTIGFAERAFDETAAAAEYADRLGMRQSCLRFDWSVESIEKTLSVLGELLADASCFPLHQLAAFARQEATVILGGDGADELLAGYGTYQAGDMTTYARLLPAPARTLLRSGARFLPSDNERYGRRMVLERFLDAAAAGGKRDHASFRRIFSDRLKQRFYRPELLEATVLSDPVGEYAAFMDAVPAGRSYLAARQHADLLFHLPSILAKVDRMSMAHGLEVRVPLLSKEMVAFCLNLDDNAKRTLLSGKRILKSALAGQIPPAALRRRKAGFLPPVDKWFRGEAMNRVFGDHLLTARSSLPTLHWGEVENFWQEHRRGEVEGGFVLLGILQYMNWSARLRSRSFN